VLREGRVGVGRDLGGEGRALQRRVSVPAPAIVSTTPTAGAPFNETSVATTLDERPVRLAARRRADVQGEGVAGIAYRPLARIRSLGGYPVAAAPRDIL
jgi:hypothetical protein